MPDPFRAYGQFTYHPWISMQTSVTRLGWVVGPAAGIVGALFWCSNAWLLSADSAIYRVSSLLSPGALALGIACGLLPGPRFELSHDELREGIGNLVLRRGRWWQFVFWGLGLLAGIVAGAEMPERIFAPWGR
jgi:hypothetical protein